MNKAGTAIGVDGCRGGWLAVAFDGVTAEVWLCPDLTAVAERAAPDAPILIDIPIGFVESGPDGRACDTLARRYLSPVRHASVFTPPCRAAVYAEPATASAVNHARTGKKLSRQSLNIIPKMRAVDEFLRQRPPDERMRWREAHPEVIFAALNEGLPLAESKKTAAGAERRLKILRPHFSCVDEWYAEQKSRYLRRDVQPDDLLDALALAVANRLVATGRAKMRSLPEEPPRDAAGLPMRMVYAEPV